MGLWGWISQETLVSIGVLLLLLLLQILWPSPSRSDLWYSPVGGKKGEKIKVRFADLDSCEAVGFYFSGSRGVVVIPVHYVLLGPRPARHQHVHFHVVLWFFRVHPVLSYCLVNQYGRLEEEAAPINQGSAASSYTRSMLASPESIHSHRHTSAVGWTTWQQVQHLWITSLKRVRG